MAKIKIGESPYWILMEKYHFNIKPTRKEIKWLITFFGDTCLLFICHPGLPKKVSISRT
jgi:hypothetical protein